MQGKPGRRGQDRAQRSRCRGPRREKAGRAQGRPRSIGKAAGSRRGCGWVTGGGGDCTSGAPGAHDPRTAHRPRRAAARRARPLPGRTRRLGGRGGGGGARAGPRGGGLGAARPGLPPTSCPPPGPGATPNWEGDGSVSRLALCAAPARPCRRPGGFVLARLGKRRGGSQPGRPLPRLALRSRRRYRGLSAAAASSDSGSGRSASLPARALAAATAAARRAPGPGRRERSEPGAPGARWRSGRGRCGLGRPFIFFWVSPRPPGRRRGEVGEGRRAGVGLQAVSHGSPSPAAVRTPSRSAQAATRASQTPIPTGEGLLSRAGVGAAARP
ncbi:serine/arginine repetitive matrix protein 3-like [Bos indicus]|uniref:Serine/arginine repetitive matrix protein 3-like n=1 Tax=Bos indicus TaxID=9915 RepID=A0ABM4SAP2_BOSIN